MDKLKYIKLENEDGSYSESIPLVVDSDHIDINGNSLTSELASKASLSTVNMLSNEVNTNTARINSITNLVDGSTTGDAELIDGRINGNGMVYENLGSHLREAERKTNKDTGNFLYDKDWSGNWFNPKDVYPGKISYTNGEVQITSSDTYKYSGYIPVKENTDIYFLGKVSNPGYFVSLNVPLILAYDEDKNFISSLGGQSYSSSELLTKHTPNGCKYIVISAPNNIMENFAFMINEFHEGDTLSSLLYAPYKESFYLKNIVNSWGAYKNVTEKEQTLHLIDENFDNIYEIQEYTEQADTVLNRNGELNPLSPGSSYSVRTFDIDDDKIYLISAGAGWGNPFYGFFDEHMNLIELGPFSPGGTPSSSTVLIDAKVIPPENSCYLLVNNMYDYPAVAKKMVKKNLKKKWENKKWVVVGDSLTEVNSKTTKHYFDYIAEETGITVINMGVSGTGYARKEDVSAAFYQRISSIDTTADIVTIFGSFNDLGAGKQIGTYTDTGTDTLAGCINTTIDNLQAVMPLANLGIVAPCPWGSTQPTPRTANSNTYVDVMRQICERRSIPFLDLWRESGLRPWDSDFQELAYPDGDSVHPNEVGHAILAPKFKAFLERLI